MTRWPNSPEEVERGSGIVPSPKLRDDTNGSAPSAEASVTSPPDSMTRDSILAACPLRSWNPSPEGMLLFHEHSVIRGKEEFRALRSQLSHMQAKASLKSILIASALPGEGRSFVAASLAQVMALQPESRVLLIDADLRTPRLHAAFGTSPTPGLSEYLLQEVEEFGIMQRGAAENLFLIPSGRKVAGSTELVANGRLKSLLDRIEPLFDWIIVDSPAAVPVSDARLLANHCDGVLLVVRSHSTPYDVVRRVRQQFSEESHLGVVLNVIPPPAAPSSKKKFFRG